MNTSGDSGTRIKEVLYPESDGKPMAETDVHRDIMEHLIDALALWFQDTADVYVSGNLLIYYEEGDTNIRVAPDVFVVKGVPKRERRVYKLWEEGKGPDVVIEVSSRGTRGEDMGPKLDLYRDVLGVREYYVFDPLREYMGNRIRAWRRGEAGLEEIPIPGGRILSPELGLELVVQGDRLRLVDPRTGRMLPTLQEADAARERAETARERAETARERAETARERAETARERAEAGRAAEAEARQSAEEQVRRLQAEIERLRGAGGPAAERSP